MSILKRSILQLGITFMIVGMMVMGIFAMNSTATFATPPPACATNTPIAGGPAGSNPNCDVAITTNPLGQSGALSFTADSSIAQTAVAVGANNFTFGVTVTDTRGTEQGWQLQAASAGLSTTSNSAVFLPLNIVSNTSTCTPTSGGPANANCPVSTFTSITLSPKPATFVTETATNGTTPISGTDVLGISGSYNVPIGTTPGAYTGAITLSLLDTSPLT